MNGPTDDEKARMRAERYRARDRAKAALKPGDRIRVGRCGGAFPTYTFVGFDEGSSYWMVSKSGRDDLSPYCVIAVNGVPTSFRDDPEAHLADPYDRNWGTA